jgi:diaminopropionate ammonia-lyase
VAVEPAEAACLHHSLAKGESVTVPDDLPVFSAGLACHTVSSSAWRVLRTVCDASVTCTAEHTLHAIDLLADVCKSGDSGAAVPVGVLSHLSEAQRAKLGLTSSSVVLCFNTEGHTVPETKGLLPGGEICVQTNPNRARL